MTPPLFHVGAAHIPQAGSTLHLDGAEGRHAAKALRLNVGEPVLISDGAGALADCEITAVENTGGGAVTVLINSVRIAAAPIPWVTVVQALPKSERSELAVELATEAGANRIVPWQSSRCIAKWVGVKAEKGQAKWSAAALAAAKQSRRAFIPEVSPIASTEAVAALVAEHTKAGSVALILHEESALSFAEALSTAPLERVLLVVGPEGGIADSEIAAFRARGAHSVVLGPEVARTSTAAALALAALGVLTGRWSSGRVPSTVTDSPQRT